MGLSDKIERPACDGKEWAMKVVVLGVGDTKTQLLRKMSEDAGLSGLVLM